MDTIGPLIINENPQRSPYRYSTLQRNGGLYNASCFLDDSLIGGSSSSSDTIRPPIDHENSQLLPYPSSTTLQSNGSVYNASFVTSPSYNSSIEVRSFIAEVCLTGNDRSLCTQRPRRYVTRTTSPKILQALPMITTFRSLAM